MGELLVNATIAPKWLPKRSQLIPLLVAEKRYSLGWFSGLPGVRLLMPGSYCLPMTDCAVYGLPTGRCEGT
jgi:hypothetical protein